MSDKIKTLCDMKKGRVLEEFELFRSLVLDPKHACKKCGRVSHGAKWLCKPIPLHPGESGILEKSKSSKKTKASKKS